MIDEAKAHALGDARLERFEFGVLELEDRAGLEIDQMIVVRLSDGFVARATALELATFEDARLLEQFDGAVDGGDRNARIDRGCAAVQFLDIGMIVGVRQDARDDATLLGNAQAFFGAEGFEIDTVGHVHISMPMRAGLLGVDFGPREDHCAALSRYWRNILMSRVCELTGKGRQVGHNVSHANNKTKRTFLPNLQNVSLLSDALGRSVRLRVSMNGLRSVEHVGGLDHWLLKTSDDDLSLKARRLKREIKAKAAPTAIAAA